MMDFVKMMSSPNGMSKMNESVGSAVDLLTDIRDQLKRLNDNLEKTKTA